MTVNQWRIIRDTNLNLYRVIGDREGEEISLHNLGVAYYALNQYGLAIQYLQQSLLIKDEIGDSNGKTKALGLLGAINYYLKQYEPASHYFQQQLTVAKGLSDRESETHALHFLGEVYYAQRKYKKALNFYQQALVIHKETNNLMGEGSTLEDLGVTLYFLGQYNNAIDHFTEALKIRRELGDRKGVSKNLNNLGIAHHPIGEYEKAIKNYQQSLVIDRELGHRSAEALSLNNLGNSYFSLGDYEKALHHFTQSLKIKEELDNPKSTAASLGNIGNVYYALSQYEQALQFHQQSLNIQEEIGDRRGAAKSLGNIGNVYDALGQYEQAINFHQQSLTIQVEISDRWGEANSHINLGLAFDSLGQYEKAINYHQQALVIAKEIGNKKVISDSLNNTGLVYEKLTKYDEAERILYDAIQYLEILRKDLKDSNQISIFDTHIHSYRNLQRVLLAQNKDNAALEVSERGRNQALIHLLARSFQQSPQQADIELPNIELFRKVAQREKATLVEYSLLSNQALVIWVVTPTGEIHMKKVILSELKDSIETLAQQNRIWLEQARGSDTHETEINKILRGPKIAYPPSTNNPTQTSKDTLKTLHEYLIQPIASYLPENEDDRIIFIPHRSLFQVPFAALTDENDTYLIHKHTIHTVPSIHALHFTDQHQQRLSNQESNALIVGNPTIPLAANQSDQTQPLDLLPGTEKEAKGIARQLNHSNLLIGDRATETEVKRHLHQSRFIHLATHGVFSDKEGNPIQGYIVLAESEQDDGLLTVKEILNLTQGKLLNAEMIVLSACETGVGDIKGEGVVGLSRALIAAGVPSVVVSLWNVEDNSAALLMQSFYTNLIKKKMDKAAALRHAMLTVAEEYPDPKHWAAFTLIGEAE